jgi:hypothetical protein
LIAPDHLLAFPLLEVRSQGLTDDAIAGFVFLSSEFIGSPKELRGKADGDLGYFRP